MTECKLRVFFNCVNQWYQHTSPLVDLIRRFIFLMWIITAIFMKFNPTVVFLQMFFCFFYVLLTKMFANYDSLNTHLNLLNLKLFSFLLLNSKLVKITITNNAIIRSTINFVKTIKLFERNEFVKKKSTKLMDSVT